MVSHITQWQPGLHPEKNTLPFRVISQSYFSCIWNNKLFIQPKWFLCDMYIFIVRSVSHKPLHGSRPNFMVSYLSEIYPLFFFFFFFFFFKNFIFHSYAIFFSPSLTKGPYSGWNLKTLLLSQVFQFRLKLMIHMLVIPEYRPLLFWRSAQK